MQTEIALQKLEEVRSVVDGELAEMVDSLAMVVRLQKDIRSPMLGAKVTLHKTPEDDEDSSELEQYKAIVIEGNVAESAPEGELWDPNKEEFKFAEDYPMGTVNCVVATSQGRIKDGLLDFEEDYATDVEVFTSITPAGDEPSNYEYTPGWPE